MSYSNHFTILQGELIIFQGKTDNILWKGKPLDINIEKVLPIPNSKDFIVLLNWREAAFHRKKNLIRITPLGGIVWEVESPTIKQQGRLRNPFSVN